MEALILLHPIPPTCSGSITPASRSLTQGVALNPGPHFSGSMSPRWAMQLQGSASTRCAEGCVPPLPSPAQLSPSPQPRVILAHRVPPMPAVRSGSRSICCCFQQRQQQINQTEKGDKAHHRGHGLEMPIFPVPGGEKLPTFTWLSVMK